MKDLFKLLAPYLTAIGSAIAVYANFQTELGIMKYRQDSMEERTKGVVEDIGSIKDLLYAIDAKLGVYSVLLEERTSKKGR